MVKIILTQMSFQIILAIAFYVSGFLALYYESQSHNLIMSAVIFTGIFSLIVGSIGKIFHLLFT